MQPFVMCPQDRAVRQPRRGKQVRIDIAKAASIQQARFNKSQNFIIQGNARLRQAGEDAQHHFALAKITQRKLAHNERVHQNPAGPEQAGKRRVPGAQMVDPNRRVSQYHAERLPRLLERLPSPRHGLQLWFAAPQAREPPRAFTLNQSAQRLTDQGGFFRQAGTGLRFGDKLVIECDRRAHFPASQAKARK
jgi:hypothetical protein